MKSFLLILLLTFSIWACQQSNSPNNHNVVITIGKLRVISQNGECGKQFLIITEEGERLSPLNISDFYNEIQENAAFQLVYTEMPNQKTDVCCLGKPIRISSIANHTSMK